MKYDILFTGDTFLKTRGGGKSFSDSVLQLFKASGEICINLETTIGRGGTKVAKAYSFQTSPDSLQQLKDAQIAYCNVANNHSLDYGREGLETTLQYLKKKGLCYIGTYSENCEIIEINGQKTALCAYYGKSGGLAPIEEQIIIRDVKRLRILADVVIVSLHWGEEYCAYPSPRQQQLAHSIINAGANVIIGHHPHVIQGIEQYHGGLIFYSLGNFNFFVNHPYAKRLPETTIAYCVGLHIGKLGVQGFEVVPIRINQDWIPEVIYEKLDTVRFNNYLNTISTPLKGAIQSVFWYAQVSPHYFNNHLPSWRKRIKEYGVGHLKQMIIWLIHPSIYKYYLGMVLSLFYKKTRYWK